MRPHLPALPPALPGLPSLPGLPQASLVLQPLIRTARLVDHYIGEAGKLIGSAPVLPYDPGMLFVHFLESGLLRSRSSSREWQRQHQN